jgi:hypothetical protein
VCDLGHCRWRARRCIHDRVVFSGRRSEHCARTAALRRDPPLSPSTGDAESMNPAPRGARGQTTRDAPLGIRAAVQSVPSRAARLRRVPADQFRRAEPVRALDDQRPRLPCGAPGRKLSRVHPFAGWKSAPRW